MKPRSGLATSLALLALCSCASTTRLSQPLTGAPPNAIAVVPLEGGNFPPRGRAIMRRLLGSMLQYRHYTTLDDQVVDQRLALAGHQPWNQKWLPADAELARFGKELGADAVLVAEGFDDSRFNAGLYFRRGLEGKLRLLDVASAKTVWSAQGGASSTGGLFLGSGQVIKTVGELFDNESEANFARFASSIALDMLDLLPENPNPPASKPRPQVASVSLRTPRQDGSVAPEDLVEIEARATPRGRGSVSLGSVIVDYPLVEVEEGIYRGTVRIEPSLGESRGAATAAVVDAFGTASEPRSSAATVSFAAPRLPAPQGLAVEVLDGPSRRVRVKWDQVPGASEYLVFRASPPTGSETLAPVSAAQIEDALPAGATSALYFVQARAGSGNVSSKSNPLPVSLQP